jgi:hypothetical protein
MGYPLTYRAIEETIKRAALSLPYPRRAARRAGIRVSSTPSGGQNIAASFTLINDALGYVEEHGDDPVYFPSDLPQMDRVLDWRGFSEAKLLVSVTEAGEAGTSIGVESFDVTFTGGLSVPLTSVGAQVSDWVAIDAPEEVYLEAVSTSWKIYNPSELTGSFGVGLCQLQVR